MTSEAGVKTYLSEKQDDTVLKQTYKNKHRKWDNIHSNGSCKAETSLILQ